MKMKSIKYENDFLELLNLKKNKKFNELYVKKKLVYLLYHNNNCVNKNFLDKVEFLVKKRKNYEKRLGFNLSNNTNDYEDYCAVEIENNVNIYQDIAGNIVNIDISSCPINNYSNDLSGNNLSSCTISNKINCYETQKFQKMISNVEKLVKFFEDTDDNFYDINNKGNLVKTLIL